MKKFFSTTLFVFIASFAFCQENGLSLTPENFKPKMVSMDSLGAFFRQIKDGDCEADISLEFKKAQGLITEKPSTSVVPFTINHLSADIDSWDWSGRMEVSPTKGIKLTTTEFGTMNFEIEKHYSNRVYTKLAIKKGKVRGFMEWSGCSYTFVGIEGLPADFTLHDGDCKGFSKE